MNLQPFPGALPPLCLFTVLTPCTAVYVQGWLGNKDTILHSGEGPIQEIKWSGSLISWANDLGVKVYDTTIHQRIAYIERPRSR